MATKRRAKPARKGGRWKPSPVWLQWDKERLTYVDLLKKLDQSTAPGGEKWREGMKRHYKALLSEIEAREPQKYR